MGKAIEFFLLLFIVAVAIFLIAEFMTGISKRDR